MSNQTEKFQFEHEQHICVSLTKASYCMLFQPQRTQKRNICNQHFWTFCKIIVIWILELLLPTWFRIIVVSLPFSWPQHNSNMTLSGMTWASITGTNLYPAWANSVHKNSLVGTYWSSFPRDRFIQDSIVEQSSTSEISLILE